MSGPTVVPSLSVSTRIQTRIHLHSPRSTAIRGPNPIRLNDQITRISIDRSQCTRRATLSSFNSTNHTNMATKWVTNRPYHNLLCVVFVSNVRCISISSFVSVWSRFEYSEQWTKEYLFVSCNSILLTDDTLARSFTYYTYRILS